MLSLILGRFFPSTGLLQTAEELRQQDRQADAELAALKAKIVQIQSQVQQLKASAEAKTRDIQGQINGLRTSAQGALDPVLSRDSSMTDVAAQVGVLQAVLNQYDQRKLLEQNQQLGRLRREKQNLVADVAAIRGAMQATENYGQQYENIAALAEQNEAAAAAVATQAAQLVERVQQQDSECLAEAAENESHF